MPESTYQIPVAIEKVETAGLSPAPGSSVATPMPTPSIVRRTWTTRRDDDAGEDRAPGDPVDEDRVGVLPGGRLIVGLGAREARCS